MLISLLWCIVGVTAERAMAEYGCPCRWEATAVVECTVNRKSAILDCGFNGELGIAAGWLAISCEADCSLRESAVIDCGFKVLFVKQSYS